jgi:ATP-dependent Clp protease ATP-binding subunit ClpA
VAGLGGWSGRPGPRGVYLFAGPTGVGKTETALLLAQILGGDRPSLVRIDCNTLQSSAIDSGVAKNRLLGVPPGYVGYARGQGGILSRVRDFPESIVLFDEFEKASSSIGQILLQILDKGQVEDVDGNLLDFRRAYVIFTTNAGSVYQGRQLGFKTEEEVPQTDLDQMKACLANLGLAEEFLGRLTHTFLFTGLTAAVIQQVLQQQLEDMRKTSQAKGVELSWSEELVPHLLAAWQISLGVRFAITVLQNRITEQLNVAEAQGDLQGVTRIRLEVMPSDKRQAGPDLVGLARCRKENNMLVISLA